MSYTAHICNTSERINLQVVCYRYEIMQVHIYIPCRYIILFQEILKCSFATELVNETILTLNTKTYASDFCTVRHVNSNCTP